MLVYKEKSSRFNMIAIGYGLTYFDEPYSPRIKVDIIREWQYSIKRGFSEKFYTLCIDLTESEETIFSHFEKNTKYEINRATQKDNVTIETLNSKIDKQLFYDFYSDFARTKNLMPIAVLETDLLIENDMFTIRAAVCNGDKIVFHSYVTANNRARLMHSASLFRNSSDTGYRNLVGRANRLLHWDDIRYFKNKGYLIYDLGGIDMNKSNKETQAINAFKESFGGRIVKEYKSLVPVSLKGLAYLWGKKLIGKV